MARPLIYYTTRQAYGRQFNYRELWQRVSYEGEIVLALAYAIDRGDDNGSSVFVDLALDVDDDVDDDELLSVLRPSLLVVEDDDNDDDDVTGVVVDDDDMTKSMWYLN